MQTHTGAREHRRRCRNVDDPAMVANAPGCLLQNEERPLGIEPEDTIEIRFADVRDVHADEREARIGDYDIEAAERRRHLVE